jgi:hypothetical protein
LNCCNLHLSAYLPICAGSSKFSNILFKKPERKSSFLIVWLEGPVGIIRNLPSGRSGAATRSALNKLNKPFIKQKPRWSKIHFFILLAFCLSSSHPTLFQNNLTSGDLIQLNGLKASMDGTLTKYKKDSYERKRLAKLDMEAIILITPDIFPSPFHIGDLYVYSDTLVLPGKNDSFNIRTGLRMVARGDEEINDPFTITTYDYYLTITAYLMYNLLPAVGYYFWRLPSLLWIWPFWEIYKRYGMTNEPAKYKIWRK